MILNRIDGALLKEMVTNGAILLERKKEEVNALNVFPVPDGDTGTNMSLTIKSAVTEMANAEVNGVSTMAEALSRGALKGARGNSGVILSQLFRGFYTKMKSHEVVDAKVFAEALQGGVDMAYKAVMKPREGTILTVSRAVAEAAVDAASQSEDIIEVMRMALKYGHEMLLKTPDMLDVLKQANVVDAGGQGLLLIYEGYLAAISGEEPVGDITELGAVQTAAVTSMSTIDEEDITFGYCTEFFITNLYKNVGDQDVDRLKNRCNMLGDSVVVVGDHDLVKIHVHTDMPGKILQYALRLGELSNIKIDNMREQHRSILNEEPAKPTEPKKHSAVVSVAAGTGFASIFRDLGVDHVVEGGQTMNPSTDDIADAIQKAHAENVFVLPNNSNIIMAAQQAGEIVDSNVYVINTKTVSQGITAMLEYQPEGEPEGVQSAMEEAKSFVTTGQITFAVRDSNFDGQEIKEGDIIGLIDGKIAVVGNAIDTVGRELVDKMMHEDAEIITVYRGEDTKEADGEAFAESVQDKYDDCDVEIQYGGQPLYYYIISVE